MLAQFRDHCFGTLSPSELMSRTWLERMSPDAVGVQTGDGAIDHEINLVGLNANLKDVD